MLYLFVTLIYLIAFYLPIPARLEPFVVLLEFSPRWLMLIPLVLLLLKKTRHKYYMLGFILTVVNVLFVMDFNITLFDSNKPTSNFVNVASYNIAGINDYNQLIRWYHSQNLDLMLLQEVQSTNLKLALENQSLHFHCAAGLCVVSQHNIQPGNVLTRRTFGGWGNFAASYHVTISGQELTVVNIHLNTPRYALYSLRDKKLNGISAFVQQYKERETESLLASKLINRGSSVAIIGGDFNLTQQSYLYRAYWKDWNNTFSESGSGFGYTKITRYFGARIDHILTSTNIDIHASYISNNLGGDHNPVISQISLPKMDNN